jgi:hypothetical protein
MRLPALIRREVALVIVIFPATYGALLIWGSKGAATDQLVTAAATTGVAFVVLPVAEFGLRYLQAPWRVLQEQVQDLTECIGSLAGPGVQSPASERPVSVGEVLRAVQMSTTELQKNRLLMERHPEVWCSSSRFERKVWDQQEPILAAYPGGVAAYDAVTSLHREANILRYKLEYRKPHEMTEQEHEHDMGLIDEAIDRLGALRDQLGTHQRPSG